MATPMSKTSKTKKKLRRMHDKITIQNTAVCPRCNSAVLSHSACPVCGFYRDKQVLKIKGKEKKKNKE